MRFYNPGPKATAPGVERSKDKSTRQSMARRGTSASRAIRGANGNITCAVYCKRSGDYSGAKGLGIKVGLSKQGSRFVMQFFLRDGSQIDGNVIINSGLTNTPSALAAKALLTPHFGVRMGDLTDQVQDAGMGASNAVFMTIK